MNDKNVIAWQCVCGAYNSITRDKCGKCKEVKKVKKYYQYGCSNNFICVWYSYDNAFQYAKFANL